MKNTMKKFTGVFFAMVMLLAMSCVALATSTNYTITLQNAQKDHTYKVYQIFTGDVSSDGSTLSNVKYGSNYSGKKAGDKVSTTDLAAIEDADTFAKSITTAGDPIATLSGNTLTASVPGGYYLIKDETANIGTGDTRSAYIVEIAGNVNISPKATSTPTDDKQIVAINDTNLTAATDTSVVNVGDKVKYQITATLPDQATLDKYSTYKIVLHDTMSSSLTLVENSLNVTYSNETADVASPTTTPANGETLTVTFSDVKALGGGATITVTYEATVNDDATFKRGNHEYLEYSNDPNSTSSTGKTTGDDVTVVTFNLNIDKLDDQTTPQPLAGAAFTLSKKNAEGNYVAFSKVTVSDDKTNFKFNGLGTGDYKLEETTTPDGYNTIDPVTFTVTATAAEGTDGAVTVSPKIEDNTTLTISDEDGVIDTDIQNFKGTTLPSTGGIGTTIFYVIGAILVFGAGVILIARKRTQNM